jgi:rhodanese-related sulfurtransferase
MIMKRLWWLLFALVMVGLVACGGSEANLEAVVADPAEAETLSLPDMVDVQTVAEIKDRDDVLVLDVREQWEYDAGHIPGVTLLPMGEIPGRMSEIPTDQTVILTCRSGNRSGQVADFLRQQGYENVHNMSGGILEWESAGLDVER